jgi:hypothetical protein
MSPFMDVQPVEVRGAERAIPDHRVVTPAAPKPAVDSPAGSITGIVLNHTDAKPQIVVSWNTGHDLWRDAQIDILRSNTKEGPWSPIAINLSNSGEYWWFLMPEDLKPFYAAVRIRSFHGGIQMDVTQSVITIDPRLAQFQR